MSDEKDKAKHEFSLKETAGCAGCVALGGLFLGALTGGIGVGIACAVIWGLQAAVIAATGYEVQPSDVS
jgi:hypothetical protein